MYTVQVQFLPSTKKKIEQEKDERSRDEVESQALTVLWPQAKGWQGIGMREEVRKRCEAEKRVGTLRPKAKDDPVNF